ncbi:PREDICTED: PML-RARA-regulated adapter molecule 1, partial [Tinamus guttatus]|uniref:PML-RARA-regulated adapter molecule 1 n=1 Tax=Tinamus guttatus TaxID=94827 RepID=UPI00052ECBD5
MDFMGTRIRTSKGQNEGQAFPAPPLGEKPAWVTQLKKGIAQEAGFHPATAKPGRKESLDKDIGATSDPPQRSPALQKWPPVKDKVAPTVPAKGAAVPASRNAAGGIHEATRPAGPPRKPLPDIKALGARPAKPRRPPRVELERFRAAARPGNGHPATGAGRNTKPGYLKPGKKRRYMTTWSLLDCLGETKGFRFPPCPSPRHIPALEEFDGDIRVLTQMMVDPAATEKRGGGKNLPLRRGEILDVIQFTNEEQILCRNSQRRYGYVPRAVMLRLDTDIYDDVEIYARNPDDFNGPEQLAVAERQYFSFPGELLMRMLKMLILPLITSSLMSGLATMDSKACGKMGVITITYYLWTTFMAVTVGIILVVSIHPGAAAQKEEYSVGKVVLSSADALLDLIRNMFPSNLIEASFQQ